MPVAETTSATEWPGGAAGRRAPTDVLGLRVWACGVCLGAVSAIILYAERGSVRVAAEGTGPVVVDDDGGRAAGGG